MQGSLLYLLVFITTLIINFFTLYFVARKSKKEKVLFTNPAFLLGDFFLLPVYFVLISIFLNRNVDFVLAISLMNYLLIAVVTTVVALIFGKKFDLLKNLLKPIWIPHGIFIWVIIYSLLSAVFITAFNNWKDVFLVVFMLILLSSIKHSGLSILKS